MSTIDDLIDSMTDSAVNGGISNFSSENPYRMTPFSMDECKACAYRYSCSLDQLTFTMFKEFMKTHKGRPYKQLEGALTFFGGEFIKLSHIDTKCVIGCIFRPKIFWKAYKKGKLWPDQKENK